MPHILKNENLEIHIDHPLEGYHFSRFDWTGKITSVKFRNVDLSTTEKNDGINEDLFGKGLYNEFGIDTALGFEETKVGGWFHKIGVGLLKKEDNEYLFHKKYEIDPATFEVEALSNKVIIHCTSKEINGYAYVLKKEIVLNESHFTIHYTLENTGEKEIHTSEYVHNFIAINQELMGGQYHLKFPFPCNPQEIVNPEQKVDHDQHAFTFNSTPSAQFFYGNLSGNETVDAAWELINTICQLGIRETGSFQTNKINLWGWKHVISPELFFHIAVKPGQSVQWSRKYDVFQIP
jgi:hypothetical protein